MMCIRQTAPDMLFTWSMRHLTPSLGLWKRATKGRSGLPQFSRHWCSLFSVHSACMARNHCTRRLAQAAGISQRCHGDTVIHIERIALVARSQHKGSSTPLSKRGAGRAGSPGVRQGSKPSQARRWADSGGQAVSSSSSKQQGRVGPALGPRGRWILSVTAAAASTRATRGQSERPCESLRDSPSHSESL